MLRSIMTSALLLLLGGIVVAQENFNGMMSTFADSTGNGMNGVMEIPFVGEDAEQDLNGVVTLYEPQPEQWADTENGWLDTFLDPVLSAGNVSSVKIMPPQRNDHLPAVSLSLYFSINSAVPGASELLRLQELLPILLSGGVREITLLGYADASGPSEFNQRLSGERAEAIAQWLKANGVSAPIKPMGMGAQGPEHGKPASLRRVDLMVEIR